MKKRILLVLTVLTMLLCVPLIANATTSGNCGVDGDNATWTFDEGTLTISGEGNMKDYPDNSAPWHNGRLTITKVIIEQGITSIGDYAFNFSRSLTSATIPDSVTSIGECAFIDCGNLNINVNSNNQNYCDIDGVLFTKDKKTIMAYAKDRLQSEYIIPSGVTGIGNEAFEGCRKLTSVIIPDGVTSIGNHAFTDCTSLTGINIPSSVISIGNNAFVGCTSLTSVNIPDGVTSIGECAFVRCSKLTSVNIPTSVTSIGSEAFAMCGSLNVYVSPNNQNYCDIYGVLFTNDKKTIVSYAKDKLQTEYVVPDNVTSISDRAFYYCESLTSVNIPDSLTSIGREAFNHCTSLTDVYYPGTEGQWKQIVISSGNNPLLNATIHYNSEIPIDPLKVKPVQPTVNIAANKIEVPVTVVDEARAEELNEVELYIAEYDENGQFVGLKLGEKGAVEGDTVTITADIPNADNYKIMLWDANNVPLMDAIDDVTNIQ